MVLFMRMINRSAVQTFESFDEADRADRIERWSMDSGERLLILEELRRNYYPDGKTAPRLQRLLESAEFPPS